MVFPHFESSSLLRGKKKKSLIAEWLNCCYHSGKVNTKILSKNLFQQRSSEVFENAVRWLEGTGDHNICNRLREFGDLHTCFTALHLIFTECKIASHSSGQTIFFNKLPELSCLTPQKCSVFWINKSRNIFRNQWRMKLHLVILFLFSCQVYSGNGWQPGEDIEGPVRPTR